MTWVASMLGAGFFYFGSAVHVFAIVISIFVVVMAIPYFLFNINLLQYAKPNVCAKPNNINDTHGNNNNVGDTKKEKEENEENDSLPDSQHFVDKAAPYNFDVLQVRELDDGSFVITGPMEDMSKFVNINIVTRAEKLRRNK